MKNKFIWFAVSLLTVTAMVLASCNSTSTSTTTSTASSTTTQIKTTAISAITPTTSTSVQTTTAATTAAGNWWNSLGTPQYGGTMTLQSTKDIVTFDPALEGFNFNILGAWMERLFVDNWTIAPSVFNFSTQFRPSDYVTGGLAASWEFTDPSTFVVHLRHGINWQNISPANGREFVASDVVAHYSRWFDPKIGYNKFSPHATSNYLVSLTALTAPDKYTVVFQWSTSNPEWVYECLMLSGTAENSIENPEAVAQWGDLNDWHHAIGTGPFILKDFVSGASATLVKNPNYWGYDERYPKNKLPYVDGITYLIISDPTTALAALRTGKLDNIDGATIQQAQDVQKTNPKIIQTSTPATGQDIDTKVTVAPYSDIKVRQALQMALDLPTIAKTYYLGFVSPNPVTLTSQYMTGWGFPYSQWPQDLKDQFAYNPTMAKQLLAQAGYPSGFKTDIVVDQYYDTALLEIVVSYFAAVGVNVQIQTLPAATYNSFVGNQHKQDALSSTFNGNLGKTTEPLSQIGKYITTNATNTVGLSDPVYDAFLTQAQHGASVDDVKKALAGANEYLLRQHILLSLLQTVSFSLTQPWLNGYSGQNDAFTGAYGPTCLGFYGARCWIDAKMKAGMGY